MNPAIFLPQAPDLTPESYVALGVATCYRRVEGNLEEIALIEPIPSAYLATLLTGVPTAYQAIYGVTLGEVFAEGQIHRPAGVPEAATFCAEFEERAIAATRTYQNRLNGMPNLVTELPPGTHREDLNYSTSPKRLLNQETQVSPEDNVKQHAYTHQVL